MTYKMNEDNVSTDNFKFSIGRGKFIGELPHTPVRGSHYVNSQAFCSTRTPANAASTPSQGITLSSLSDTTAPALNNMITHNAHQVGQSLKEQLRSEHEERGVRQHAGSEQCRSVTQWCHLSQFNCYKASPTVRRERASNLQGRWVWQEHSLWVGRADGNVFQKTSHIPDRAVLRHNV